MHIRVQPEIELNSKVARIKEIQPEIELNSEVARIKEIQPEIELNSKVAKIKKGIQPEKETKVNSYVNIEQNSISKTKQKSTVT